MRELKFRAWDRVSRQWLEPYPKGFSLLGETTCFDLIGEQLKELRPDKTTVELIGDVDIVQYTEIKDKNGKEVYENDIVGLANPDTLEGLQIFGVIRNGVFHYDCGEPGCGVWILGWYIKCVRHEDISIEESDELEVIGNIYENPEMELNND